MCLSPSLSPSKGQYYHAIELKREYYDNAVTSLQQPHQNLVITLVQVRYGKFDKSIKIQNAMQLFSACLFH